MDASLFPHKSPFPENVASFNHFEQNARTCLFKYNPSEWIFNLTREPSRQKGEERRDENTFPLLPPSTWCSGGHRCYPRCTAQPFILPPPAASAPLHGRRRRTKMVVFQRRRHLQHTPPLPALTAPYPLKCPIRCHLLVNVAIPREFQGYHSRGVGSRGWGKVGGK